MGIIIDIAVPADVRVEEKEKKRWESPKIWEKRSEDCGNWEMYKLPLLW